MHTDYVGVSVVEAYLGGVCSGSGRLPDRVRTASPSGYGWLCTGPPGTHTPAAALSSTSTPSCPRLWLYILHANVSVRPERHTHTLGFYCEAFFSAWCIHAFQATLSLSVAREQLLLVLYVNSSIKYRPTSFHYRFSLFPVFVLN